MKIPVKGIVVFSLGAVFGFLTTALLLEDEEAEPAVEDAKVHSCQDVSLDSKVVYISKGGKAFHRIDCPSCVNSGTELYPVTLFTALQRGKHPCTNCNPLDLSH